ncbi:hypothetical protein MHYP_G00111850 [Metynnis hypsauchen]
MEEAEVAPGSSEHGVSLDLNYILMQLDSFSASLDQLEVKTHLLQYHLTMSFTHPDKSACLSSGAEDSTWLTAVPEVEN